MVGFHAASTEYLLGGYDFSYPPVYFLGEVIVAGFLVSKKDSVPGMFEIKIGVR